MQQIEQGIFYEDAYLGVTIGALVFPYGVILIDAPLRSEDARSFRATINNYRGGPNRLLISLDSHPDRTLGTRAFECTVAAHQKAAHVFRNRPTIFKGLNVETGAIWETFSDAIGMRWASPDITFSDRMYFHWGGPQVRLESRPGANQGSIWVVIPEQKTVFVGDTSTPNQPPFLMQADIPAWLESLDVLLHQYKGYQIVSGRAGLVKPEDLKTTIKFLKDVSNAIEGFGAKNAPPEVTGDLANKLISRFPATGKQRELYLTRLRYGLFQYYARRFHPVQALGQPEIDEEEQ
ncbi:MAG: hypothetical protein B6D39_05620 [Anaerolineae bacterium UTCFX2]|jgi:glyoxylase-like metal-dependent hydrolase (beta-lactamase superfamily II)|nr:hypothetical protein [Anaerolineales bacterium]OQY91845.1 MAG: hypothetical protein B6D39_05620 [Anaerolineae bacterium UTCFX2]